MTAPTPGTTTSGRPTMGAPEPNPRTGGLVVDPALAGFVADELLPGLDLAPEAFWAALAELLARFDQPVARALARRDEFQAQLDAWHRTHGPGDPAALEAFLVEIGYLPAAASAVPTVTTTGVDPEISLVAGPQLVVPATNARFALNAANARWGSLFDALYGTDALPGSPDPAAGGYDPARGAAVIAEADRLLDEFAPLRDARHADVTAYRVAPGPDGVAGLVAELADAGTAGLAPQTTLVGHHGDPAAPTAIVLRHHGLHVELLLDRAHPVGREHHAGLADVVLESAVTTIVDLEDSVATVDGPDKVSAYRTWLGLLRGNLTASFTKGGRTVTRKLAADKELVGPRGEAVVLPGRALLLVRTVGLHLSTPAVRTAEGDPVAEHVLDLLIAATAALHDLRGLGRYRNSRTGSGYVVRPKLHGPEEVALTVELLGAVEQALGLPPRTLKVGIMDEERRTSLTLEACVAVAADRVVFVNTGFLDRTGDEIHSCFEAGPVVRKSAMKDAPWLLGYEDRNVDVALAAGFPGRAQIGKGMWAKPAAMADMLASKGSQPAAGASCAWVPSPTAATLHALHYHRVDVPTVQAALAAREPTSRRELLRVPVLTDGGASLSAAEIEAELATNAQAILGYVVRWVSLGVGCSTVPDLAGVGLMEDRATLRISSQHIANWLHHGVLSEDQVRQTFATMATVVDEQNAGEPGYPAMAGALAEHPAYAAALDLVLTGRESPNGYTEPALTRWRTRAKA